MNEDKISELESRLVEQERRATALRVTAASLARLVSPHGAFCRWIARKGSCDCAEAAALAAWRVVNEL